MKIGILETGYPPGDLSSQYGSYPDAFAKLLAGYDLEFETWDCLKGNLPQSATLADGWLITGSRHGEYESHKWITPLENLIRAAYERHIPLVGICFGHQLIAQALGGRVEKSDKGWGFGKSDYRFIDSNNNIELFAVHQDQVVEKPADAKVIATSDFCEFAMLAYGSRALTIQPHPEFSQAFFVDLMATIHERFSQSELDQATASLQQNPNANDSHRAAKLIADFFHTAHKKNAA